MKRWILIVGVIAVLIVAGVVFTQYRAQQQASNGTFQTEPARRGSLTATVGATGSVRPNQSAVLTWQTSGTVGAVPVQVGETVSAGEELANLTQTSLPQSVILAQADLVNAQQALEALLESDLPAAQALQALEEAERTLEELAGNYQFQQAQAQLALLNAQEALEDAEYDVVQLDYDRADQSVIDAAEADYILAQNEVDKLQKEYNKVSGRPEDDPVRALALSNLSAAKQRRDAALRKLNWYKGNPGETEIEQTQAELALAQADLVQAQQEWTEVRGGPSPAEIAVLEAQLQDAERELERLRNGPHPDDVKAAQARVAAALATLDLATINAPFEGTLTEVQTKVGDLVSPGSPAFRLDDLSRLLVDVEVSEVDINRIEVGQSAALTFDAVLGKEYSGEVAEVALVGDDVQGAVNFNVTVELLDADVDVRPGMTAAVTIVVTELEDVLLVPNRAVRVREGQRVVYVLRNGVPEPVEIVLGASSDTASEVANGELQPGDPIVLNPPAEPIFFGPGGGGGFQ